MCYRENSKLPANYIGIFLTAQGLAGIFSNLYRFATIEIWPDEPFVACFANFAYGVITALVCVPAQLHLNKNAFARHY